MEEQVYGVSSRFRIRQLPQEGHLGSKNSAPTSRLCDVFLLGLVRACETAGLNIAALLPVFATLCVAYRRCVGVTADPL